jgi:hypothetical protein
VVAMITPTIIVTNITIVVATTITVVTITGVAIIIAAVKDAETDLMFIE